MKAERYEEILAEKVKTKVIKSQEMGTKASWTMEDQLDVAAQAVCEAVADEVEPEKVKQVLKWGYNQSATAQKLERAFAKMGHFQREPRKGKETVVDYMDRIAAELAAKG
jgi:hypothetical protein